MRSTVEAMLGRWWKYIRAVFSHALTFVLVLVGSVLTAWDYFVRPFVFRPPEEGFARVPVELTLVLIGAGLAWGGYRAFEEQRSKAEALTSRLDEGKTRRQVKYILGVLSLEAQRLATKNATISGAESQAWWRYTVDLIRAVFGDGELAVFFASALARNRVRESVPALGALILRSETVSIRPSFDPDKWLEQHPLAAFQSSSAAISSQVQT